MDLFFKLVVLGVIQGLTEFLPVSSKGHLVLGKYLLGVDVTGNRGATVEIALHAGTIAAVVLFMWRDLLRLAASLSFSRGAPARSLLIGVIVATIPAGVVGVLFKDRIETWFELPRITGYGFLFTAAILLLATRFQNGTRTADDIHPLVAFVIGCAQVIALFPGISRSGTTIVAGLLCGLSPKESARFSFLVSLPVITGAVLVDLKDLSGVPRDQQFGIAAGIVASFITGLLALRMLTFIAGRGRLPWFAAWLIPLGIVTLACF